VIRKRVNIETERESNIELFRIISMFLIVAHHYVVNSGLMDPSGPILSNSLSATSLFLLIWGGFGKIGINCFVLITGYFMCKSRISAKKFLKLFLELMFYRVVINGIFWISGYTPLTVKGVLECVIPFRSVATNFTGTYLIFFLCIPFLNILIHSMTEKQHIRLLSLSVFTYVFFGSMPSFSVTMNYVSWYIVLYLTASYVRLYPRKIFSRTALWGVAAATCVLLCCISIILGSWLETVTGYNMAYYFVTDSNKLLAFMTGLSSFMFFNNLNVKTSRFINTVSSTMFGVLMIHANSDTMRHWLWKDVFHNVEMYSSDWIYLHAIFSVVAVFIGCVLIDLVRIRVIERPFFASWDKHLGKITDACMRYENKICSKLKIDD